MMTEGCLFCKDAGADFDWCRVCGRGATEDDLRLEPSTVQKWFVVPRKVYDTLRDKMG